jgi:hypothetical protein
LHSYNFLVIGRSNQKTSISKLVQVFRARSGPAAATSGTPSIRAKDQSRAHSERLFRVCSLKTACIVWLHHFEKLKPFQWFESGNRRAKHGFPSSERLALLPEAITSMTCIEPRFS